MFQTKTAQQMDDCASVAGQFMAAQAMRKPTEICVHVAC
jgi:hypothetical protein